MRPLGRAGIEVGPMSYGAAALGNLGGPISDETAERIVDAAWEGGIRYFDVAPHYGLGLAEERLGRALARRPRDEFVVSTKVGRLLVENPRGPRPDDEGGFDVVSPLVRRPDYSRDGVVRSLEQSLDRMGLDRIDIVLVHDPDDHYEEALAGAFPALEELRAEGVIRSYGAGMNQSAMLADFVRQTELDVVMCAGRYTLLDQRAAEDLLAAAVAREVSVVAAAVFNSGVLASDPPRAGSSYDYGAVPDEILDRARAIAAVCHEHGVLLPAAALQFPRGHTAVSTVCVGARSPEQLTANLRQSAVPLPSGLWAELRERGLVAG
ncbi:D-threo-aldose 1-dehydrogenase [Compostimonas suwonensis]|uniref:D-threo-aldose 1-dehydrogenase n=2 Tax=Compostimonas suwonensis TaxID=1048394 RepID=A0A2M9BVP2_9MICO|nr:D-threo-aldose 1-dehydrogenase [Compostimonas suwonensis]